jgi:hypothetical protein
VQVSAKIVVPADRVGSTLSFKVLVNDEDWQVGANEQAVVAGGAVGYTYDAYPWFGTQAGQYAYIPNVFSPQVRAVGVLVSGMPLHACSGVRSVCRPVVLCQRVPLGPRVCAPCG